MNLEIDVRRTSSRTGETLNETLQHAEHLRVGSAGSALEKGVDLSKVLVVIQLFEEGSRKLRLALLRV